RRGHAPTPAARLRERVAGRLLATDQRIGAGAVDRAGTGNLCAGAQCGTGQEGRGDAPARAAAASTPPAFEPATDGIAALQFKVIHNFIEGNFSGLTA